MFNNILHRVLLFVLSVQKLSADDATRRQLLDEEKEAVEKDIAELQDDDTKTALQHVIANASAQPSETATHGDEPQLDLNPLGLSAGAREQRMRVRETAGTVLGKSASAAPAVPPAPAESVEQSDVPEGKSVQSSPAVMRAKMRAESVTPFNEHTRYQQLGFSAVGAEKYGEHGESEDNTFALYTPTANLAMTVRNPALLGVIEAGDLFYVDFIRVPKAPVEPSKPAVQKPVDDLATGA